MKALITGGAGFIGTNLALALLAKGWQVIVYDNLSRVGTKHNLTELKKRGKGKLEVAVADIRDLPKLKKEVGVEVIFHLAAQTAVTTSIVNPVEDFEVNALGSLNVLEAARTKNPQAIIIYSSTNKVYGSLEDLGYTSDSLKYGFKDYPRGVGEEFPLDFHSPYGCSKGAADSYFKDYARIYDLNTVVFRQSCIYGPWQLGLEDQGWVAHLGAKAILGQGIKIFGDGKQVRDLLYVDDLIEAYLLAIKNIKKVKGEVFNIGGGSENALSVLEYVKYLERKTDKKIPLKYFDARTGDQKVFISDNSKLEEMVGWKPSTSFPEGLFKMLNWTAQNLTLFNLS